MKIGVISDVHSNKEALSVALKELRGCDEIVCLGDICHFGADTNECFEALFKLKNFSMVKGNHDVYSNMVLSGKAGNYLNNELASYAEHMFSKTKEKFEEYIRGLPYTMSRKIQGIRIAFTHYNWETSQETSIVPRLPLKKNDLRMIFSGIDADIIFFGHTHFWQDVTVEKEGGSGKCRYINFGSLGTPHELYPYARFGIVEIDKGVVSVERKEIPYNVALTIKKISKINHPFIPHILKKFFNK